MLTDKQRQVLHFIQLRIWRGEGPPSLKEIAAILGSRNPNAAKAHTDALRRKGYITWDRRGRSDTPARTIQVLRCPLQVWGGGEIEVVPA